MKLVSKIGLATLVLSLSGLAQAAVYDIDSSHSEVGFKVRHFVAKTGGIFKKFSGKIEFDEKKSESIKVDAVIETASVDTSNDKRDEHLRGADFFNVEKFPTMTFKSTGAKKGSDGKIQVMGDLTILGVTKPVTLDVSFAGVSPDSWGGLRSGFSASGKVNRKDFGMVYNSVLDNGGLMLGEDVDIMIEIEGIAEGSAKKKKK